MDHPEGAGKSGGVRLGFDRRVRLEFHGSKISSDGGLLLYRELDEVLSLHDMAGGLLKDVRKGRNCVHTLVGLLRQSPASCPCSSNFEWQLSITMMLRPRTYILAASSIMQK